MNTVLACVDFSSASGPAVDTAAALALMGGARLYLLQVTEPAPTTAGPEGVFPMPELAARRLHAARENLTRLRDGLRDRGIRVQTILVEGGAAVPKIVQEARRLPADMIVMGSHGHGALLTLLMGSTTQGVLRHAPCPVLIVPSHPSSASGALTQTAQARTDALTQLRVGSGGERPAKATE